MNLIRRIEKNKKERERETIITKKIKKYKLIS